MVEIDNIFAVYLYCMLRNISTVCLVVINKARRKLMTIQLRVKIFFSIITWCWTKGKYHATTLELSQSVWSTVDQTQSYCSSIILFIKHIVHQTYYESTSLTGMPESCGGKEYIKRRHGESFKFLFLPKMGLSGSQASTRKKHTESHVR